MPKTWTLADGQVGTADWSSQRYAGRQLTETVVIDELHKEGIIETKITLNNTPVTVSSTGAGPGVGGLTMYEFPQEHLRFMGAVGNLTFSIEAASQANTVADFEGDLMVGTLAPADADVLPVDATDDDLGQVESITAVAFAGSASVNSAISTLLAVNASPPNVARTIALNAQIDAGDISDNTSVTLLVSGIITVAWASLGAN